MGRSTLAYNLRQSRHEPLLASGGLEGLRLARQAQPDLVLLDLMLPDLSGKEVCLTLKRQPGTRTVPVIMLTARGDEVDRVLGFELGAEDYVVKPFSVRELLLRIDVALRRKAPAQPALPPEQLAAGPVRLDLAAHRAWSGPDELRLTTLEFRLLALLLSRRGRVQSREALVEAAWGGDSEVDPRTVDSHVKNLREKLGAAGRRLETVRGEGYRFWDGP